MIAEPLSLMQTCALVSAAVCASERSCRCWFEGGSDLAQQSHLQVALAGQSAPPRSPTFLPEGPHYEALEVKGGSLRVDEPYSALFTVVAGLKGFRYILA